VWKGNVQKASAEWKAADDDNWLTSTHPRTAIGLSKDGKTVIQVTVDGRWTKTGWPTEQTAIGMSTDRLGKLMRGLGCYKAMNFDGGGGTAMWVYGEGNARNIVNKVCENRWDWDGTKLRPTGNAVYIKSDLKK
jgi:exopolysaccharide biosynthesis protein